MSWTIWVMSSLLLKFYERVIPILVDASYLLQPGEERTDAFLFICHVF